MKILKFNETINYIEPDYKEYDEYALFNKNIVNEWKNDLDKINIYLADLFHDFHRYNDFIRNFVIFDDTNKKIIANDIQLYYNDHFSILFSDDITKTKIKLKKITDIKSLDEIAKNDPNFFLELYKTYIEIYKAPYMDVFGKENFQHILDAEKKYNL